MEFFHPEMTCHWIRTNVRHIGILHLVSISTTSPQSTCHSAPVCEILSKSDRPRQKKITLCRFPRRRISAILDFRGPIIGSSKSPCRTSYRSSMDTIALNCSVFDKIAFFPFWWQDPRWQRFKHANRRPIAVLLGVLGSSHQQVPDNPPADSCHWSSKSN